MVNTGDDDPIEEQCLTSTPAERPSREGSEPTSPLAASPADIVPSGEGKEKPVQPDDNKEDDGAPDIDFREAGGASPVE